MYYYRPANKGWQFITYAHSYLELPAAPLDLYTAGKCIKTLIPDDQQFDAECELVKLHDGSVYLPQDTIFTKDGVFNYPSSSTRVMGTPRSTGCTLEQYKLWTKKFVVTAEPKISQYSLDVEDQIDPLFTNYTLAGGFSHYFKYYSVVRSGLDIYAMRLNRRSDIKSIYNDFNRLFRLAQNSGYEDVVGDSEGYEKFLQDEKLWIYTAYVRGPKQLVILRQVVASDSRFESLPLDVLLSALSTTSGVFINRVGTALTNTFIGDEGWITGSGGIYDEKYWGWMEDVPSEQEIVLAKYTPYSLVELRHG